MKRGVSKAQRRSPVTARRSAAKAKNDGLLILTIGHSTRPIDEFLALLQAHGVTRLVDVRTVPRSRHNPQFGQDHLPASLKAAGIAYEHQPSLGGLRRTSADSPNQGWRNLSFRGYADYMQTTEFQDAVEHLIEQARGGEHLVLMCAEAVPWRCHRSLIADALLVRGVASEDIRTLTQTMPHRLTPFARVRGTRITYPSDDAQPANAATTSNVGAARPRAATRSPTNRKRGKVT